MIMDVPRGGLPASHREEDVDVVAAIIGLALALAIVGVVLLAWAEGPTVGETAPGDGVPAPVPGP